MWIFRAFILYNFNFKFNKEALCIVDTHHFIGTLFRNLDSYAVPWYMFLRNDPVEAKAGTR
jgi:hypothetical protein